METVGYHAHRIDYEPNQVRRGAPSGSRDYWFNVYDEDDSEVFRLRMRVDPVYAHFQGGDANVLALELGLRWVRGLIDLGRYTPGETYYEARDVDSEPSFGVGSMTEDRLRMHVLSAAERSTRVEMRTHTIEGVDVIGMGDVLGVPVTMVKDVLAGLLLEGLVESFGATFGRGAVDGHVESPRRGRGLCGSSVSAWMRLHRRIVCSTRSCSRT